MLKICLFIGFLIAVSCDRCYHTKCEITRGIFSYCYQKNYRCYTYNSYKPRCEYYKYANSFGYEYCLSSEKCTNDPRTGKAKCVCKDDCDTDSFSTALTPGFIVLIVLGSSGGVIAIYGTLFCIWRRLCCFKNMGNQYRGRAVNSQPAPVVTYNQSAGAVETTPQPGGKPATQYPVAQYPPPPQYPSQPQYPPPQYPPQVQYPPNSGYPPPPQYSATQYPPPAGYPPPPSAANPPALPADTAPPASGGNSAENPYVEAFRG